MLLGGPKPQQAPDTAQVEERIALADDLNLRILFFGLTISSCRSAERISLSPHSGHAAGWSVPSTAASAPHAPHFQPSGGSYASAITSTST
jgi:hypothetical protein